MSAVKKVKDQIKFEIIGLVFLAWSFLLLICIFNPQVSFIGVLMNNLLLRLAGHGGYFIPVLFAVSGLKMILGKHKSNTTAHVMGMFMIISVLLTILHLSVPDDLILQFALAGNGGGLIGGLIYYVLLKSFGFWGLWIILATALLVGLLLITNRSMFALFAGLLKISIKSIRKMMSLTNGFLFVTEEEPQKKSKQPVIVEGCTMDNIEEPLPVEEDGATCLNCAAENVHQKKSNILYYRPQCQGGDSESLICNDSPPDGLQDLNTDNQQPKNKDQGFYKLPPISLLTRPGCNKTNKHGSSITASVEKLEKTLGSFGIKCKVTQVTRGPAITRYEIEPPLGVKVSRIVSLADDIALNMASSGVRIEAPVPGKAVVGIEVPNQEIATVYLRELVETAAFQQAASYLTFALGKDIAGQPVVDDLARMPHLLIAGATGAGKSVCLNTILGSILYKSTPDQVKMLIIDPKMVELSVFNNIPHLVSPVVTDPKKAATSLRWAVKEMEYRYGLFAQKGVRDINRYNELLLKQNEQALPLLVIVIDELADLMMVAPTDVEDAICRLAQMARASGIHLLVATQRPSVDIITGLIKANIPSRISFAVSSQIDSRTILDTGGAEKLLGRGDMLYYPVGAPKPVRVLGAYLSDREVEQVVQFWSKQAAPTFDEKIDCKNVLENKITENEDEMVPWAIKIFVETGHASISLLQRRLRIGYARAARLMDIMEKKGYVGGYEGSKPRTVLITAEEYQNYYGEQTIQGCASNDK